MKTITNTFNIYSFDELSEQAKQKAIENYRYNSIDFYNDIFFSDSMNMLESDFPDSDLKIEYNLSYRQGDGLNIYGDLCLYDFIDHWSASEKEKRTIKFYLDYGNSVYKFTTNNHYSYSKKHIDRKYIDNDIEELIEDLQYNSINNIKTEVINKFYYDMIEYFENLDNQLEKDGYSCMYPDSDYIIEDIIANDVEFYEDGSIY